MIKEPIVFSIIIPALNEELALPLLLKDLSLQSFKNFEVVIIDGNSEDKTLENIRKFSKTFPFLTINSSKVRNVSVQRNIGAEIAKGAYLLFNDADNRLPSSFLSKLHLQITNHNPDIFSVFMKQEKGFIPTLAIAVINFYTLLQSSTRSPYVVEALFGFKREVFHKLQGLNPNLPVSEGTDILRRARKKGYHFKVFSSPRYIFSLRRLEKEGFVKITLNVLKIELLRFFGKKITRKEASKIYPMYGGSYYNNTQSD